MNEINTDVGQVTPIEKPYTFRPLGATDMMPMFRIIGKIGIDEFSKCFNSDAVQSIIKNTKGKDTSKITDVAGIQVLFEVANVIITHIPNCETEIFQMLASVSGLSVDEIKAFDFVTYTRMIIDFVKKEEFKDFIGVVSELFK